MRHQAITAALFAVFFFVIPYVPNDGAPAIPVAAVVTA